MVTFWRAATLRTATRAARSATVSITPLHRDRTRIMGFIRKAMKPARFAREPERFEPMRANLNRALAFTGLSVAVSGELSKAEKVQTLRHAERRARELREELASRGVHPDVMRFCRQELLQDYYFHAVLEAVKSIAAKVRSRTKRCCGWRSGQPAAIDRIVHPPRHLVCTSLYGQQTAKPPRPRKSRDGVSIPGPACHLWDVIRAGARRKRCHPCPDRIIAIALFCRPSLPTARSRMTILSGIVS